MDIVLIILSMLCLIIGLLGCIVPALPSVLLSYLGMLLLHFTDKVQFSLKLLIIMGVITVIVRVLDFVVPAWGTKKFGGSKLGTWGSIIGLIVGMFLGPWGIIIGPFVGAVVFELIEGKETGAALRAGWGSFVGLMTGTVLKLICCGLISFYCIKALIF